MNLDCRLCASIQGSPGQIRPCHSLPDLRRYFSWQSCASGQLGLLGTALASGLAVGLQILAQRSWSTWASFLVNCTGHGTPTLAPCSGLTGP